MISPERNPARAPGGGKPAPALSHRRISLRAARCGILRRIQSSISAISSTPLVGLAYGGFGERRGDAALAQIVDDAGAAELVIGQAGGGEAFGETLVVQVAEILQTGERFIHVGGVFGAKPKLFHANSPVDLGTAAERLQCVVPQCRGVQPLTLGFFHDWSIYWNCRLTETV